jgi:hypothetical protein
MRVVRVTFVFELRLHERIIAISMCRRRHEAPQDVSDAA